MMASEEPYVMRGGIQVPASDDRDYRYLELPNKMRVVLVSDPVADKAGAALAVNVGSFSDPDELPGLAHFTEHLLFLGTEKYPDENEYAAFLSAHGGDSNAWTASEYTNYHFGVQAEHLEGALDGESATNRELLAVDSENSKNLQSDMWRCMQLDMATADPGHAYHKFGTGNKETLSTIPRAAGIDTRDAVQDFVRKWYSANLMTLCVVGKQSLDTLAGWVTSMFSGVRNADVPHPAITGSPYRDSDLGVQHWVVPVRDTHTISVWWCFPDTYSTFRSKPAQYLSHLFGHEGKGSILSLLKARGLALSLWAGTFNSESHFSRFYVEVSVDPAAFDRTDEIVSVFFQYARMLQAVGPQEWVHNEVRDIANASFRFADKQSSLHHATNIASNMHTYPTPDFPVSGESLYWEFEPEEVSKLLETMTPEKCRVRLISQKFADICTEEESWYKTAYKQEPIAADRMEAWKTKPIDPALHLPEPNPFIATDFRLRHEAAPPAKLPALGNDMSLKDPAVAAAVKEIASARATVPQLIRNDDRALVFFAPDTRFGMPKLRFSMWLVNPAAYDSPRSAVLVDLYNELVQEELNELTYHAECARVNFAIGLEASGCTVTLSGFNHKLAVLAERMAAVLPSPTFTNEQFELFRAKKERDYANRSKMQPYQHCINNLNNMLNTPRIHTDLKMEPVKSVTPDELRSFVRRLTGQVYLKGIATGNATTEEVLGIVDAVLGPLGARPLPLTMRHSNRVSTLPFGMDHRYTVPAYNPDDENSAIESVFQIGLQSNADNVFVDLLGYVLREPFFDSLRTKQTLGYMAWAGVRIDTHINAIRFIFQSDKVSADELDRRIDIFVQEYREKLAVMPEDEFETNVRAVLMEKLQAPKKLSEIAGKLRSEVSSGAFDFDRSVKETQRLLAITKEDLLAFYDAHIAKGGLRRRKIVSLVEAGVVKAAPEEDSETKEEPDEYDVGTNREGHVGEMLSQDQGAAVAGVVGLHPPRDEAEAAASLRAGLALAGIDKPPGGTPVVNVEDREAFRLSMAQFPSLAASNLLRLSKL